MNHNFKQDRCRRACAAGLAAEQQIESGDYRGAWATVRAWYQHAGDRPSAPSNVDLERDTVERQDLYQATPSRGEPIEIQVTPFNIDDEPPSNQEIIDRRMKDAVSEMSHYDEFDYIVINNHFDTALKELLSIFCAKRLVANNQIEAHKNLIEGLLN